MTLEITGETSQFLELKTRILTNNFKMADELVLESIKISIGKTIIFWTERGYRYEGKILDCSDLYLKYFDTHKNETRLVSLENLRECELR